MSCDGVQHRELVVEPGAAPLSPRWRLWHWSFVFLVKNKKQHTKPKQPQKTIEGRVVFVLKRKGDRLPVASRGRGWTTVL